MALFDWQAQLTLLTNYLRTQQEALLAEWRARCQQNGLTATLPGGTFLFDTLIHRLSADPDSRPGFADASAVHQLTEQPNALHLFRGVIDEALQRFWVTYPTTPAPVMVHALRQLMYLASADAASQAASSEQEPGGPSQHHFAQLRQYAHDIRATLGILSGATALLQQTDASDEQTLYVGMLDRNLVALEQQLAQLMTIVMPP